MPFPIFEHDPNNKLSRAKLGPELLPTPSDMQEGFVHRMSDFELPNGDVVSQVRFSGRTFKWEWQGLDEEDQMHLRSIIRSAGMDKIQLGIPTLLSGGEVDVACVRADGDAAYEATVRWNNDAGKLRWAASMAWREVPGTCTP